MAFRLLPLKHQERQCPQPDLDFQPLLDTILVPISNESAPAAFILDTRRIQYSWEVATPTRVFVQLLAMPCRVFAIRARHAFTTRSMIWAGEWVLVHTKSIASSRMFLKST